LGDFDAMDQGEVAVDLQPGEKADAQ